MDVLGAEGVGRFAEGACCRGNGGRGFVRGFFEVGTAGEYGSWREQDRCLFVGGGVFPRLIGY